MSKLSEKNEIFEKKSGIKEKLEEFHKIKNTKNLKKINFKKVQKVKINASMPKLSNKKELLKKDIFKRSSTKMATLSLSKLRKNKIKTNNEKYPQNLMIESKTITKFRRNKFYLAINNKKNNDIYNKNKFLNKINKKINEKSINNSINTQILLKKTEIFINSKENLERQILKERNKINKNHSIKISKNEQNFMESIYFNDINEYNEIILSLYGKTINYIFKCKLCPILTNIITGKTKFDVLPFSKPEKKSVLL